jgi:uncharacterized protein involved in exopolysaccharide biosynthesis
MNMPESSSMTSFDIKKYWGLVLKRKCLALSVALAALTLCTVAGFMTPNVYETKCTVFVQRNTIIGSNVTNSVEAQLRTFTERIKSESFLERVVKKLGLTDKVKNRQQLEWLIQGLQANLTVTVKGGERGADLFVISHKGADPARVRDTLNTIVSEYIAEDIESARLNAAGAYEFLQSQLAEYKSKLAATDRAIGSYTSKSPAGVPQESRLSTLNRQLATLRSQYTENHPEVLKILTEIENLKKQPQIKGSSGMGGPTDEWSRLQSDRISYQATYTDLLRKIESARLSKDIQSTDQVATLKVVDPAPLPSSPVKPNRVLYILAGIAIGITAGVGVVLAIDYFNPSFKDEDSVEAGLRLPVLVSIPSVVTESDIRASVKFDRKVLIAAAAYFSIILMVLIREVLRNYFGMNLGGF